MFHNFFNYLSRSRYLSFFSLSLKFILWSAGTAKSTTASSFFFFCWLLKGYGLLTEIRWSVCMSKSQRSLCVTFSRTDTGLFTYHLFVWSNLNFLHNSMWLNFPTQSCLVLYSFSVNLLHSLIVWLMVLSLSPHNLHLQFCCLLSILTFICLSSWRCFELLLRENQFLS